MKLEHRRSDWSPWEETMFKILLITFFLATLRVASSDEECCETFEKEMDKKWNAHQTLCTGDPSLEKCCETVKSELKNKSDAVKVLCPDLCPQYSIVYTRKNVLDYVISTGAPSMTAITACFWIKTDQKVGIGHYISYAVPGSDNEFLIYNQNALYCMVKGSATSKKNVAVNDGKWHSVCCTWSSQKGEYKIYKDGKMVNQGVNLKSGQTIKGDGTWVLGHDQDKVGGGFVANQMMQGEMTEANIWNEVLPAKEILKFSFSCTSNLKGNVKSWSDFRSGVRGKVTIKDNPSCCKA